METLKETDCWKLFIEARKRGWRNSHGPLFMDNQLTLLAHKLFQIPLEIEPEEEPQPASPTVPQEELITTYAG